MTEYDNHGKLWTAAHCRRLRNLIGSGVSFYRAGVILGRSEGACRRVYWAFQIEEMASGIDDDATLRSLAKQKEEAIRRRDHEKSEER